MNLDLYAQQLGIKQWFDYQLRAFEYANSLTGDQQRMCLHFRTGAGKSITALVCLKIWGHDTATVIAPQSTHDSWLSIANQLGMTINIMTPQKWWRPNTTVSRTVPIIADELHTFGGHKGKGWKKLDTIARHLQAPMILASATPSYNDAERVYCVAHILDPVGTKGGYLAFLYKHCITEPGFKGTPVVTGFHKFNDAEEFLVSLPGVMQLLDERVVNIKEHNAYVALPDEMAKYGYDDRANRVIASSMEWKIAEDRYRLFADDGMLRPFILHWLTNLIKSSATPVLIYCDHSTVAEIVSVSLQAVGVDNVLVTGSTKPAVKAAEIQKFREGKTPVLVGTKTLATGTDGLDKICDVLVILHDTPDNALRTQLIGRILPRGIDSEFSHKHVHRLTLSKHNWGGVANQVTVLN